MQEFFYKEKGIYYRTNDFKPNRLTLIFIHGVSSSSSAWFEFEEIFGNKYNILTYDLRGHGKSLKFPKYSDYKIESFSEDIFNLVKYVGIQRFVLISHSFGTFVAMEFLAEHQDMLSGIVFLSPSISKAKKFMSRVIGGILGITRIFELFPLGRRTAGQVDYIKYKGTGDFSIRRLWADICNTSLRAYLFSIRRVYYFNRDDLLKKINIPVLVVHGKKDTYIPIKNSFTTDRIKNSEFITIENADHIIVLNNVQELSQAIYRFLDRIKIH
ncbi:MAG: alpha/beta hydrolase [Candidatus Zambryskibacteria bacterium]|nr:alpha/beta hydrolase [Candidatus Zambryskibacteria bacterium]